MIKQHVLLRKPHSGFSLLEMIVVIAILAILTTIMVPNLQRRAPDYELKQLIATTNNLLQRAAQDAIVTQKVHRVVFDVAKSTIKIQLATDKKDDTGKPAWANMTDPLAKGNYVWPKNIELVNFFINGVDELKAFSQTTEIWFFIVPEGLAQPVIINIQDRVNAKKRGLVLNPFTVQFNEYDEFQKA